MVLPNAAAVLFAVQMNARELLLNFVPLRCAYAAQAEIRHVCWQMFAYAWRLWPVLSQAGVGKTSRRCTAISVPKSRGARTAASTP
jgi:thymidylate synthase ThyX